MAKVLWDEPDYNGRDSNSMDMKKSHNFLKPSFSLVFSFIFLWAYSHLFSNERVGYTYLSFHSPPKLIFHEVPALADRTNLQMLGAPVANSIVEVTVDLNKTIETSEFPLTSYDENSASTIEDEVGSPELLPPVDPFTDFSIDSSGVDSTDELIQIFENMNKSSDVSSSRTAVNFIPPYTLDSGNFKIESRANYTRRVRP